MSTAPRLQGGVLARGVTDAGIAYTARAVHPQPVPAGLARAVHIHRYPATCAAVAILTSGSAAGGVTIGCPAPAVTHLARTSVDCAAGLLTVTALAPDSVARVRLTLSNGRMVVSPLIAPPRSSGASRIYFQIVRGPAPVPVSLAALAADGHALSTVRLARVVDCTRHPLHTIATATLATDQVAGNATLKVTGERHSFLGHDHTCFDFQFTDNGPPLGSQSGSFCPQLQAALPVASTTVNCGAPGPRELIYTFAPDPRARVTFYRAGRPLAGHQLAVPRALVLRGTLAYAVTTPGPLTAREVTPGGHAATVQVPGQQAPACTGGAGSYSSSDFLLVLSKKKSR